MMPDDKFWGAPQKRPPSYEYTEARLILLGLFVISLICAIALLLWDGDRADAAGPGDTGPDVVAVQESLREFGYVVKVDGKYGPRTARAVRHFQRASGLLADGIAGPVTSRALNGPVRATQPAVRVNPPLPPPPPPATGPCAEWVDELTSLSPGWNVAHFQQIMYRESRCQPAARNASGATGLLQIMPMWVPKLAHCGVYSTGDLTDGVKNICGAAHIYRVQGIGAWSQTS